MKKLLFAFIFAGIYLQTNATASFDVLNLNRPDLVIKDFNTENSQDNINVTICNYGNSMDQDGDIIFGLKTTYGSQIKIIKSVKTRLSAGQCITQYIGKASDFGIYTSGNYYFKGAVKISYYKTEVDTLNNNTSKNIMFNLGNSNTNNYYQNTNNNYYNNGDTFYSSLPDFNVNKIEYYNSTTITDGNSTYNLNNALVAQICNYGNHFNSTTGVKVTFTQNSQNYSTYIYTRGGTWSTGECRSAGIQVGNINLNPNTWTYVTVKVDEDNKIPEKNESDNQKTQNTYIPNYTSTSGTYNNGNRYYYCNSVWQQSSYSNGYYCNGSWYNFDGSSNYNYTNYNSTGYYCNSNWYSYSYNDTGYYCNGRWYNRDNSNYTSTYSSDRSYYCNGRKQYSQYQNGYYCNNVFYYFSNNNNNSYDNGYYCNNKWYIYNYNDNGYYCNSVWYSRNRNNSNSSINRNGDLSIGYIKADDNNRRVYAQICNNSNSSINEAVQVRFISNGKSYTSYSDMNLYSGACTEIETYARYSDLGIDSRGNYSITVEAYPENSYSSSFSASRTENLWIDY